MNNNNWRSPAIVGVSVLGILSFAKCAIYILQKFFKETGTICKCSNRVQRKVIIVTGGNSGIGFETALSLSSRGACVYILCRNRISAQEAINKINWKSQSIVRFIHLDYKSLQSIKNTVRTILINECKVDIIIHNAGIFHATPEKTENGYEKTYQTNFIGPVLLTEMLMPSLVESNSPRVIFLSSRAQELISLEDFSNNPNLNLELKPTLETFEQHIQHYASSKFALKLYATSLSKLHSEIGMQVSSVDPGNVYTPVYRNCFSSWFEIHKRLLMRLLMQTPREGAQSVIHACNVSSFTPGSLIRDCKEVVELQPSELEYKVSEQFMKEVNEIVDVWL